MSLTLNHLRWWTEKSANVSFNSLLFLIKSFQFVSVYALVYRMYPWPFHAFKILEYENDHIITKNKSLQKYPGFAFLVQFIPCIFIF